MPPCNRKNQTRLVGSISGGNNKSLQIINRPSCQLEFLLLDEVFISHTEPSGECISMLSHTEKVQLNEVFNALLNGTEDAAVRRQEEDKLLHRLSLLRRNKSEFHLCCLIIYEI
ncbi:hypothetical protein ILYODFUR_037749 [Ilyodon furcidens]|uniref:Uncharacterized protein n=1 Tax=Ilyodon furcidens TaxID=33524 RepID=A0ABV0U2T2_9TELE